MDEQKQAVEAVTLLGSSWQWIVGGLVTIVVAPYIKWNHARIDKHRDRLIALEETMCNSAETKQIVEDGIKPLVAAHESIMLSQQATIARLGQLSDTLTKVAMHTGSDGNNAPHNRRGSDPHED